MLIGICGGTCAGKSSVASFLVKEYGFQALSLQDDIEQALPDIGGKQVHGNGNAPEHDHQLYTSPKEGFAIRQLANVDALQNLVTPRWREKWVLPAIWDEKTLEVLMVRSYFILISVDAPITLRWERFLKKQGDRDQPAVPAAMSFEDFARKDDQEFYRPDNGLAHLMSYAKVRLLNSSDSLAHLRKSLASLVLTNEQRLRPSWDQYFMELASLAAQRSNCMKRKVGCVLVRDKRVISTGYSGTPRGVRNCNEGGCPRCNGGKGAGESLATCLCIHAEENALLEAGRERIREGSILYCDTCPCLTCTVKIVQVGISEVVYSRSYSMDMQTAAVFKEAGVKLRQFSPPLNGLVDLSTDAHPII